MSKPSARGWSASIWILTQPSDCFRLTKVERAVLYEDNLPFFVRDLFRRIANIPIYERIMYMSWVKWKQQLEENGFASAWKKETTHHLTICSEPHFQTEVESGRRTGGTNTSRFSSSTGAVATREKRETIVKKMVVNFIVNWLAKLKLQKIEKCWEATAGQRNV